MRSAPVGVINLGGSIDRQQVVISTTLESYEKNHDRHLESLPVCILSCDLNPSVLALWLSTGVQALLIRESIGRHGDVLLSGSHLDCEFASDFKLSV